MYKNHKKKYPIQSQASVPNERPILRCSTGSSKTNWFPWYDWWGIGIGKEGEEFKEQFDEGMAIPFNRADELDAYPLMSELPVDKDYFILAVEQRQELADILVEEDRKERKKEMFVEWAADRNDQNLLIRSSNSDNKKAREMIVEKSMKEKDKILRLIADIMASMDRNTQDLVKAYRRPFNAGEQEILEAEGISVESGSGSGPKYTYNNALKSGNWYHVFEAAKAVTVTRLSEGTNDLVVRERQNLEKSRLEQLKWVQGSWTSFRRAWRNQLDVCEAVGCELSDQDKRIALMGSLNKDVFSSVLFEYKSSTRRNDLPQTFLELSMFIEDEFSVVSASKEGEELIRRIESKRYGETALKLQETKKENSETKREYSETKKEQSRDPQRFDGDCHICLMKGHRAKDCPKNNKKFSIESNIAYQARKREGREDAKDEEEDPSQSKWVPTKGTKVTPPGKRSILPLKKSFLMSKKRNSFS
jgi:hypothetical protein